MRTRIATELRRSNLDASGGIIDAAINTAVSAYETEFGAKMQSRSLTVTTVANQASYTTGLSTLLRIDWITLQIGNSVFGLEWIDPQGREVASANDTNTGQPGHWTWYQEAL